MKHLDIDFLHEKQRVCRIVEKGRKSPCSVFLWLVVLFIIAFMFCGCTSVRYVPVESVHTDTVYQSRIEHDSIHVRDSIRVHEKGDTVFVERFHERWREVLRTDTIYRSRVDSIQVPYPVEKPLTRWQQVCIDYGKITFGATVVLLAFIIVWIVRKIRKK